VGDPGLERPEGGAVWKAGPAEGLGFPSMQPPGALPWPACCSRSRGLGVPNLPRPRAVLAASIPPDVLAALLPPPTNSKTKVLVCSDAMTRGMDVEGVANVVNYDAPVYVKTYVHRAGRTARAGEAAAWQLPGSCPSALLLHCPSCVLTARLGLQLAGGRGAGGRVCCMPSPVHAAFCPNRPA
jgi:hypothetical protein